MDKKTLLIPIIIIILLVTNLPKTTAAETQSTGILDNLRFINTNSTTEVSLDQTDISSSGVPIDLNKTLVINVTVGLTGKLPSLFPKFLVGTKIGNWIMFRDKNKNSTVNVTLSVTNSSWCKAELEKKIIKVDLLSNTKTSTKLMVTIKETSLALQEDQIKLKAEFSPPESWMFKPSENETSFKIISKYSGNIKATIEPLENVDKFIVKPNVNTTLPLNITNNFNGETKVKIDFNNDNPELNWSISLSQNEITIPKGKNGTVNIIIKPSSSKEMQELKGNFTLTPKSTVDIDLEDQYLTGNSIKISIGTLVKKSSEDEFEINTNMLIILIVIIVILVITVLMIRRKKA